MPDALALLRFLVEAGADEAIGDAPVDRTRPAPPPVPSAAPAPVRAASLLADPGAAVADARARARSCATLEELRAALAGFEGTTLKATASSLVFADGAPGAPVMFVGEAPGREEDARGLPFVGPSGQLLDRMLAAIGLDRRGAYIANILPWWPPGNRNPSQDEIVACLPFLERHIELAAPRVLVLLGATAARTLLNRTEGINRLRGRWYEYAAGARTIAATATFHPAYLLRQPAQKREVWLDLLALKERLAALA